MRNPFASATPAGRPAGSVLLGRRFTAAELAQIAAGTPVAVVVETAGILPPPLTGQALYDNLFP